MASGTGSENPALRVEYCAQQIKIATECRNEGIPAMLATGASLREIADAADLTHSAIRKVLLRKVPEV